MNSRAERKRLRERIKAIMISRFVEKLEEIGEFTIANEETDKMIQKLIKDNPRDKELYTICWDECFDKVLEIGEIFLTERNKEARFRKIKKYKMEGMFEKI